MAGSDDINAHQLYWQNWREFSGTENSTVSLSQQVRSSSAQLPGTTGQGFGLQQYNHGGSGAQGAPPFSPFPSTTPPAALSQQPRPSSAQLPAGTGPGSGLQSPDGGSGAQAAPPFPPFPTTDFLFQYPPPRFHPPTDHAPSPAAPSPAAPSPAASLPATPSPAAPSSNKGKKRMAEELLEEPSKKMKTGPKARPIKGKVKEQEAEDAEDATGSAKVKPSRHGGRASGARNYTKAEIRHLLKILKKRKPMGLGGWQMCGKRYNRWATKHGRPERDWRALRTKFDSLANTPKPTGKGEIPSEVEEAWQINSLIEERACMREVNDNSKVTEEDDNVPDSDSDSDSSDLDDEDDDEGDDGEAVKSDSDIELVDAPTKPSKKASASVSASKTPRTASTSTKPAPTSRRVQTTHFMNTIANALDPAQRGAQDEARFARKLVQAELDALRQDKRELEARNRLLEDRVFQLQLQLQHQGMELARLQARLDMQDLLRPASHRRSRYDDYSPRTPRKHSYRAVSPRTPQISPRTPRISPRTCRFDYSPRMGSPSPSTPSLAPPTESAASGLEALAAVASSSSHV